MLFYLPETYEEKYILFNKEKMISVVIPVIMPVNEKLLYDAITLVIGIFYTF